MAGPGRRDRALNVLRELRGLWHWFLAQRAIFHPGELGLQDLWAYQTDQQTKGYAAGTINRRLDYVIGIARALAECAQPVDHSVFRLRYLPRPQSLSAPFHRRRESALGNLPAPAPGHARPPPAA